MDANLLIAQSRKHSFEYLTLSLRQFITARLAPFVVNIDTASAREE